MKCKKMKNGKSGSIENQKSVLCGCVCVLCESGPVLKCVCVCVCVCVVCACVAYVACMLCVCDGFALLACCAHGACVLCV